MTQEKHLKHFGDVEFNPLDTRLIFFSVSGSVLLGIITE